MTVFDDMQDFASESSVEAQRNRKRAVKLISIVIATFAGSLFVFFFVFVFVIVIVFVIVLKRAVKLISILTACRIMKSWSTMFLKFPSCQRNYYHGH